MKFLLIFVSISVVAVNCAPFFDFLGGGENSFVSSEKGIVGMIGKKVIAEGLGDASEQSSEDESDDSDVSVDSGDSDDSDDGDDSRSGGLLGGFLGGLLGEVTRGVGQGLVNEVTGGLITGLGKALNKTSLSPVAQLAIALGKYTSDESINSSS